MRSLAFKPVEDLRAFFPNEDLRSDRGGSIVAFAYLEECLTDAIKWRFVNKGRTADELLKVGAPLGDANAKVKLAYVMNICSKDTMQDIVHLAWVRNRFAHWHVPVDFAHDDIRGKIESPHDECSLLER